MSKVKAIFKNLESVPPYTVLMQDGSIWLLGENPFHVPNHVIYRGTCSRFGLTSAEYISVANQTKKLGVRISEKFLPENVKNFISTIQISYD